MHILALHGFTGLGSDFDFFSKLCAGQWHCPNLPGHGPNPQLECDVDATLSLIQNEYQGHLSSCKSRILLGYSMGARAALLHALAHPDQWSGLILISPNAGIEDDGQRQQRTLADHALAQRIKGEGVERFLKYWQQTAIIKSQQKIPAAWRASMQAERSLHTAQGLSTSLIDFGQGSYPNLWDELSKLTMPTLLITGANDYKYTQLAERITTSVGDSAQHEIVASAGHMPHLEVPDHTAAVINNFFSAKLDAR